MRLKSYYATSVDVAIQQARRELGEDAMLVDSRKAPPSASHLGAYEVVFALPEPGIQAKPAQPRKESTEAAQRHSSADPAEWMENLAELRREMGRMSDAVSRAATLSPAGVGVLSDPECARLYHSLIARDVASEVAYDLLGACLKKPLRDDAGQLQAARLRRALRDEMLRRITTRPELGNDDSRNPRIVALVGPPGAGKTTTLVKLAAQHGLRSRKPMQILSLDVYRIAAAEQLRTYAAILGAGFQKVDSSRSLAQCLEENRHKYWIWIDTPGLSGREADVIQELAEELQRYREIDIHLVLSATMKSSDLRLAADRYGAFRPAKLLFTHLDETNDLGGMFSLLAQRGLPLSFVCNGQQIPEDVEAANVESLLNSVAGGLEKVDPVSFRTHSQAGSAVAGL